MDLLARISELAAPHCLFVSGVAPLSPEDGPKGTSAILISPDEPAFWPHFTQSPEWLDGQPDPVDRWSFRVISNIAEATGTATAFPFGGAPFLPFYQWATRSGRSNASPIRFLVHERMGLFASYRGALITDQALDVNPSPSPCPTCEQPCLNACPVDALNATGYDVPKCKAWIATEAGSDCARNGCLVRRACPVGQDRRLPEQSAYFMSQFQ